MHGNIASQHSLFTSMSITAKMRRQNNHSCYAAFCFMTAEDSAEYALLFLNKLNDDDDADECFKQIRLAFISCSLSTQDVYVSASLIPCNSVHTYLSLPPSCIIQ